MRVSSLFIALVIASFPKWTTGGKTKQQECRSEGKSCDNEVSCCDELICNNLICVETMPPTTSPTNEPVTGDCVHVGDSCDGAKKCCSGLNCSNQECVAPDNCNFCLLSLTTDRYAGETSWVIQTSGNNVVASGSGYDNSQTSQEYHCVPEEDLTFTIYDSWGDGICCGHGEGSYEISCHNETFSGDGRFTDEESFTFKAPTIGTDSLTQSPTSTPTKNPTSSPTENPTSSPTSQPTTSPTGPTEQPTTEQPTSTPTKQPTTSPTKAPTSSPTEEPTTEQPTSTPTKQPTTSPTKAPTSSPTEEPTLGPTNKPTVSPTKNPTSSPTTDPTASPTHEPSASPTKDPSSETTTAPTACNMFEIVLNTDDYGVETSWALETSSGDVVASGSGYGNDQTYSQEYCVQFPNQDLTFTIYDSWGDGICCKYGQGSYQISYKDETFTSSGEFTQQESFTFSAPTDSPTQSPTSNPTKIPTSSPTSQPTTSPTGPTEQPTTEQPTSTPTKQPTTSPTKAPTSSPTEEPTLGPTNKPTVSPTKSPTSSPTTDPTASPTHEPSASPTKDPSSETTTAPTACNMFEIVLNTDDYGVETSWALKTSSGDVVASGSGYGNDQTYSQEYCVQFPNQDLTFTIYDSFGDGICCTYGQGSYQISYKDETFTSSGEFNDEESYTFHSIGTDSTTKSPTTIPTKAPTSSPVAGTPYYPGDLTVNVYDQYGRRVKLSTGMMGRAIAYSFQKVQYTDGSGGQSSWSFHDDPDAAACFPSSSGGFYYSSNSEVGSGDGGVGVIEFDANGEVIGYRRTLTGTSDNCGGGKSPWGSWISCEEDGNSGRVWQTDPAGVISSQRTEVVAEGGNYESFAYDDRRTIPHFFVTEDDDDGPLVRFIPDATGRACYNQPAPADKWCTLEHGTHSYLRLNGNGNSGSFEWRTSKNDANPNWYPNAEGIDVVDGILYFASKEDKALFTLDLDQMTYNKTSTQSGAFNLQPDQLKTIVSDPNGIIYFCEDGGSGCDLHGRDYTGQFFTILKGDGYDSETTGLAFCGNGKYMMLSFQYPGVIWQFWREDGLPFSGNIVDIKYH